MAIVYGQKTTTLKAETTGSAVEAAAGIAIIVLSIIGLARGETGFLASIATIVLGAAMFVFGATIASEYARLLGMASEGMTSMSELASGMTVEVLAGGAAVILGILALIGIHPGTLLPSAVITVGAALALSAASFQRLTTLKAEAAGLSPLAQSVSRASVTGAVTAQVLAGISAIVLGILALTTYGTASLIQVGLLVLGVALTVSGLALTGRMVRSFGTTAPTV